MRYPLIDGQGNFGSVDGDPPAAMRYTRSTRLARIAAVAARRHRQGNRRLQSPTTTKASTSPKSCPAHPQPSGERQRRASRRRHGQHKIPPHNLREIVEACIALVQNPAIQLPKLIEMVQGPDFPTGGVILGREGIYDYFKTRPRLHQSGAPKPRPKRWARTAKPSSSPSSPTKVNKAPPD